MWIDLEITAHLSQKLPADLLFSILKSGKFITEVQTTMASLSFVRHELTSPTDPRPPATRDPVPVLALLAPTPRMPPRSAAAPGRGRRICGRRSGTSRLPGFRVRPNARRGTRRGAASPRGRSDLRRAPPAVRTPSHTDMSRDPRTFSRRGSPAGT